MLIIVYDRSTCVELQRKRRLKRQIDHELEEDPQRLLVLALRRVLKTGGSASATSWSCSSSRAGVVAVRGSRRAGSTLVKGCGRGRSPWWLGPVSVRSSVARPRA